jgi:putative membrane protein
MKMPSHNSLSPGRTTVVAATVAILMGAASAAAQSSSTGSTSGSSSSNQSQPTTATGSGYHSGTAAADVDSTKEINAANSRSTTGAGAMTGRDSSSHRLSWSDRRFVSKAADDGKAEVQIAELAAQRATNPEVKSFAQKMVDDHTKVNSELMSLAGQKNLKIDSDDDQDRAYKRLNRKSGSEFDQEFVEHMIDAHEDAVKLFDKAAQDAKDPDVRAFATKHVDHLREHLQIAQGLKQSIIPTGRTDNNSGRSTTSSSTSSTGSNSSDTGSSSTGK